MRQEDMFCQREKKKGNCRGRLHMQPPAQLTWPLVFSPKPINVCIEWAWLRGKRLLVRTPLSQCGALLSPGTFVSRVNNWGPKLATPVPKTQPDQPHHILFVFRSANPFETSLNENESIYLKDILQHFYTFQAIWILLKVKFIFWSQIKKHNFQIFQKSSERQTETEGDKNTEKKRERERMTTADIWGISGYSTFWFFFLRTIL